MAEPDQGAAARKIVVELTDARQPEHSGWFAALERVLKSATGAAMATLILTTVVGGYVSYKFSDYQRRNAAEAQSAMTAVTNRASLIDSTTKVLSARRSYEVTLANAIQNNAPMDDVKKRWEEYRQSYVEFNAQVFTFKAAALEFLGAGTAQTFTPTFESKVSLSFSRTNDCLTEAYYDYVGGAAKAAIAKLDACRIDQPGAVDWKMKAELDRQAGCISTFETELAYSIYIENKFDTLPVDQQVVLHPYSSADLSDCNARADWVCLRQLNRAIVTAKFRAACAALDAAHYVAPRLPAKPR